MFTFVLPVRPDPVERRQERDPYALCSIQYVQIWLYVFVYDRIHFLSPVLRTVPWHT